MNDEYEPLDPEHEAVVKAEPDDDGVPLDLDRIEADWRGSTDETRLLGELGMAVYDTVPDLIAELRATRAELDRWKALPTRREYTVDATRPSVDTPAMPESSREQLAGLADDTGRDLWARPLHVGPWQRLDAEAPF